MILALKTGASQYEEEIETLENKLIAMGHTRAEIDEPVVDITERLRDSRTRLAATLKSIRAKTAALGVNDRANLRRLAGNKFLELRVNALALKLRIRERLRARAFERERLDQLYRNVMNGK